MIIRIKNFKGNISDFLRRAGYVFQKNTRKELVFVKYLSRASFPRFHLFAERENDALFIKVHLDKKRTTYGRSARHHAAYGSDEKLLKEELERIKFLLLSYQKND